MYNYVYNCIYTCTHCLSTHDSTMISISWETTQGLSSPLSPLSRRWESNCWAPGAYHGSSGVLMAPSKKNHDTSNPGLIMHDS